MQPLRPLVFAALAVVLAACGGGSASPPAKTSATAAAPGPAAPAAAAAAAGAAADEPVIDVCALFPRAAVEKALGKIDRTRNLNVTDPKAPMRTAGGSGGCFWEGAKLGQHMRIEVHSAASLARQGLGSPRRYIDMGWAIGADASAVDGLGEVARTRPSDGKSIELIAGTADRTVHLLASGISRDQAVAVVRAGLEQIKLP